MRASLCCLLLIFVMPSLGATAASLVVDAWQHRVFSVYPVEKIQATEELAADSKAETVELTAARGEREPFLVLVRPNVPLREVSVVPGELKSADGAVLSAAQFEVHRLGYIYIDEPSGTRIKQPMPYPSGTGQFADPLLANAGEVRPKHNLQFLVTVQVPRDAKPGRYTGEVRLRFRKESWMPATVTGEDVLPIALTVRRFAMPEPSPLLNTAATNLRELPEPARTPERLAAWQQTFVEHRQTPEPLLPAPKLKLEASGDLTAETEAWEQAVGQLFARGGTHVFIPVWGFYPEPALPQGLYFLYHHPAVTGQKWLSAKICSADRQLTPEFRKVFGAYLRHMHAVLQRRGWLERAFIATMDEPYTYHTADRAQDTPENNYEVIRNFVALVREAAPGLRTFCTADPVPGLIGSIDHWCLRNLDYATAARERAEQHGEVVTFCDNYRTFIDYPAIAPRSFGWVAWRIGARGWLTYETLGGYRTAWEGPVFSYPQFSGATVWGMGQMFYPDPLTGAPLSSLRWEMMREGCDDYEYLWLLHEALKRHPNPEAQRLLETAPAQIASLGSEAETMTKTSTSTVISNQTAHQLREQVAAWIERLDQ